MSASSMVVGLNLTYLSTRARLHVSLTPPLHRRKPLERHLPR